REISSAFSPLGADTVRYPASASSCSSRSTFAGSSSTMRISAPKVALQLAEQGRLVDRLGEKGVATPPPRPGLVVAHGARREHDHGDLRQAGVRLQAARRLPPVHARQREVHQDEVGPCFYSFLNGCLSILREHQPVAVLEELHQQLAVEL